LSHCHLYRRLAPALGKRNARSNYRDAERRSFLYVLVFEHGEGGANEFLARAVANNFWGKDDAGVNPMLERLHGAKQTCDELKAFYLGMSRDHP